MTRDGVSPTQKYSPAKCVISEKTGTVFREINTGDVRGRLEKSALLKALRRT